MKGKSCSLLMICFAVLSGALAGMTAFPLTANADIIAVTGADLISSRSTPAASGVVATDGWNAANGGFQISWDISFSGGLWHYSYTISNADGTTPVTPDVSHLILEVSLFFTDDQISNANAPVVGPQTFTADPNNLGGTGQAAADTCAAAADPGDNGGNPCLPANIFGIKLDAELTTYTFDSDKAPVWGDFYTKDGSPGGGPVAIAWNTGIGGDPAAGETDFTNWIPTPDTENGGGVIEVPEPSTFLMLALLGSGLIGSGTLIRRKNSSS